MGKKIKIVETCRDTEDRLSLKERAEFRADESEVEGNLLNIYSDVKYQEVEGFGGAFTETATATLDRVTPEQRKELLIAYFDKEKGIGYNFCRTTINSCDYSINKYTYDDVDGDFELKHFSIEHDTKSIIPAIREAFAIAPDIKLYASPWSPPVWMKTNGDVYFGGKLKKECYEVWARYVAKYLTEYKKAGVNIWGITVQNEAKAVQPWESCVYTAEEERDLVKNYLGPILEKEGLGEVKIMFWDHNKERTVERTRVTLGDPDAAKYFHGIGVHFYSGDHFGALSITHELFPNLKIYGTEACNREYPENPWFPGERYAHDIIGSFNNWMSAWTDWNMTMDEKCGPCHWREEQIAMGDKGKWWLVDCPIKADLQTGKIRYSSSYYYIGHFSKYIKRGARRIGFSLYTPDLEAAAFENPDGQKVIIVMNRTDADQEFTLRCEDGIADFTAKARSIQTLLY